MPNSDTTARTEIIFVKEFRHWRSGKIIRAEDYGKRGFPIRVRRKR